MPDAQNTDQLQAARLELACKIASIVLFVAAFMLAAVGVIHLAVLPGLIEHHLHNVAIEMAALALLLAVASVAVGVLGMMFVSRKSDAKRLLAASLGLAVFAVVGVLLAKFVIRGIFGMGSLTRPGALVVLCSAVIAFACARTLPKKPAAENAEGEGSEDAGGDGDVAEDSADESGLETGIDDADMQAVADEGGAEDGVAESEPELNDVPDDDAAGDEDYTDGENPGDAAAEDDAADTADATPSDVDGSADDEPEDDAPTQGAHFGNSRSSQ